MLRIKTCNWMSKTMLEQKNWLKPKEDKIQPQDNTSPLHTCTHCVFTARDNRISLGESWAIVYAKKIKKIIGRPTLEHIYIFFNGTYIHTFKHRTQRQADMYTRTHTKICCSQGRCEAMWMLVMMMDVDILGFCWGDVRPALMWALPRERVMMTTV